MIVTGKNFAVLGLARSGITTVQWLHSQKAHVWAWDDNPSKYQPVKDIIETPPIDWKNITALIQSPGIPLYFPAPHPITQQALDYKIPIWSDIDLLRQSQSQSRFIGVTGTNGKSTTTALIGHLLKENDIETAIGGNIGIPALSLPALGKNGTYVLELSSFQLDLSHTLDLECAVWLNISPDHLDRHGSIDAYVQAKKKIFEGHKPRSVVIGIDDHFSHAVYKTLLSNKELLIIPVSIKEKLPGGIYVENNILIDDRSSTKISVINLTECPTLLGLHNQQNAALAYAAAITAGLSPDQIAASLRTFPGLAHRQEILPSISGIRFVNDSKATNADSTSKALTVFDQIYWIVGGRAKEDGIDNLHPYFKKIRHAFLIGESQHRFAKTLNGLVPYTLSGDLATAVTQAYNQALQDQVKNAVILLSPACASFDQFQDFEHRGEAFRNLVSTLSKDSHHR